MNKELQFENECRAEVIAQGEDASFASMTSAWIQKANQLKYSYHFKWLGRPIIQYPQDILAIQEILFEVQPDLIIETGVAHGGSLIFSASLLEIIALMGGNAEAKVIGIEIELREHNRKAILAHPLARRIELIDGSSTDPKTVEKVADRARGSKRTMVILDSMHTESHVMAELDAYAPLVTKGSYCVVFDTIIESLPQDSWPNRPWGRGNNPLTALKKWLPKHPEFEVCAAIDDKLAISVAKGGYLKRVS